MNQTISRIELLPDHLINQIAAGEVIERPASVVKELLDNSLDANASQVTIDIERGGIGLIRVKDDGEGIHRDDLALALTRHATSKIRHLDDLRKLISMGFRGEALPSIASISRLTIMSGSTGNDHAWMIKCEGRSDHLPPEPVSHPQGTTIEVRDLFFNVPARRKYLRTERTEFYQIQQLVRHFAISHPEQAVRLTHNGRQILNLKSASENQGEARVSDICGTRFMQQSIRIDAQDQKLHLSGWIGKPEAARTMNDSQFFCLNRRCIRDKRVNHAIQQAFQDRLPIGRFAVYALCLEIDPVIVDVNVHPAKTEVRFREGRTVHDFIYSALNQALNQELNQELNQIKPSLLDGTAFPIEQTVQISKSGSTTPRKPVYINETANIYRADFRPRVNVDIEPATSPYQFGNVFVVQKEDELILIDIQKAKEALCSIRLKNELKDGSLFSKPLLFPYDFKLNEASSELINKFSDLLKRLGIELKFSGDDQWQLRQIPEMIYFSDAERFSDQLLEALEKHENNSESAVIKMLSKYHAEYAPLPDVDEMLEKLVDEKMIVRKLSVEELQKLISDQS